MALAVVGCGGGGSGSGSGGSGTTRGLGDLCPVGSPATATLTYSTGWAGTGAGQSQIIEVLDAAGTVLRADSVNRGLEGQNTLTVAGVPTGVHEVRARLFDGTGGTGTELGRASVVADLCSGATSVVTGGDQPARRFVVNPSAVTLSTGQTRRAVGTVLSRGGTALFVGLNSITWGTSGVNATVSASGVVTGVNQGSDTLTGTWAGSLQAFVPVTVANPTVTRSKWTVLVYLNAANDLFRSSDLNMNQMERVADRPDNLRFVVQWKQSRDAFPGSSFDGVRRYLVKPDQSGNVASELLQGPMLDGSGNPLDMGDWRTLREFVQWGMANYPSDRTILVVWNHGNGWRRSRDSAGGTRGFSYDDQSGNAIQTWEIGQALSGINVDVLAWDASLMQMMEVAYEARGHADYVVGSEESPPADGYPYEDVFRAFRDNPDASTEALTENFVTGMLNNPPYATRKITQSVIRTDRLTPLAQAIDGLAGALIAEGSANDALILSVRGSAQAFSDTPSRKYRDLIDICQRLKAGGASAAVSAQCDAVIAAAQAALIWEGSNAQSPNANGISIDFMSGSLFAAWGTDYRRMNFAADTRWDEFLAQAP